MLCLYLWLIRDDFDVTWWLPNLYLMLYPLFFIPKVIRQLKHASNIPGAAPR
jgi:hypothetical protein